MILPKNDEPDQPPAIPAGRATTINLQCRRWFASRAGGEGGAMTADLYNWAQHYATRGWSLIPLAANKRPAIRKWKVFQDTRPTDAQLREWFQESKGIIGEIVGMAVVCGEVSGGIVVRDFDRMDAYTRWTAKYPDMAASFPTVETARGRHVYFLNGLRKIITFGDGELRGAGYVCLPPTLHPTGMIYEWLVPLPAGPLPTLEDPVEMGLGGNVTECTEVTEKQRILRDRGNGRKCVVLSVTSPNTPTPTLTFAPAIENAIKLSLPASTGQRHRQVFKLARALKGIPSIADRPLPELKPVVRRWHEAALNFIATPEFEETWCDFVNAWPNVRYALGESTMDTIMETVLTTQPPAEAGHYEAPAVKRLVGLCALLQQQAGAEPFYLDARTAAKLLETEPMTAWRWLRMLKADGVLVEVEKGKPGRATRWRWIGGAK